MGAGSAYGFRSLPQRGDSIWAGTVSCRAGSCSCNERSEADSNQQNFLSSSLETFVKDPAKNRRLMLRPPADLAESSHSIKVLSDEKNPQR
jgi:hypothetical protein